MKKVTEHSEEKKSQEESSNSDPKEQIPDPKHEELPKIHPIDKDTLHKTHEFKSRLHELEMRLKEKEEHLKHEKEKVLRALADSENFKKRKEQEKEEFCKFANERLIKELLPVLDSFDYAVDHALKNEEQIDKDKIIEGFMLIQKQLHCFLEKMGVTAIQSLNCLFDPNVHQAVLQEENKEIPVNTVVKEMQKGYQLNSRIIRPAMVIVSK